MKRLQRWLGVTLGLAWVVVGMPAGARGYEILEGKGTELCEVCLQNLLRQSAEEAVCDRQYASELGLNKVAWAQLNLPDHVELLMRMNSLVRSGREAGGGLFANVKEATEYARGGADGKRPPAIVMERADVDFDHDGVPDQVLRYEVRTCKRKFAGWPSLYESALVVLKPNGQIVDYAKTDLLIQYPLLEDLKSKYRDTWRSGIFHLQMYQVFTYKGSVYFDRWDGGSGPDTNTISIYQTRQGQARRVCHIRLFSPDDVPHN